MLRKGDDRRAVGRETPGERKSEGCRGGGESGRDAEQEEGKRGAEIGANEEARGGKEENAGSETEAARCKAIVDCVLFFAYAYLDLPANSLQVGTREMDAGALCIRIIGPTTLLSCLNTEPV